MRSRGRFPRKVEADEARRSLPVCHNPGDATPADFSRWFVGCTLRSILIFFVIDADFAARDCNLSIVVPRDRYEFSLAEGPTALERYPAKLDILPMWLDARDGYVWVFFAQMRPYTPANECGRERNGQGRKGANDGQDTQETMGHAIVLHQRIIAAEGPRSKG